MIKLVDFSKFTSVKIGGIHKIWLINSLDDEIKGVMIGGGNNLLISPNPPQMSMLGENFDYIKFDDKILEIGGACKSGKIYNFAKKNDIANFEFLKSIPGTLGGLVKMNAGLCGLSISDNLTEILLKCGWVKRDRIKFDYRYSGLDETIYAAKFHAKKGFCVEKSAEFEKKRSNQPKGASFGSCFVNPKGDYAGRLIEAVGLKGYAIGGAKFSEQHANFLINFNKATFNDVISLIKLAQSEVFKNFNIELKTEVMVL